MSTRLRFNTAQQVFDAFPERHRRYRPSADGGAAGRFRAQAARSGAPFRRRSSIPRLFCRGARLSGGAASACGRFTADTADEALLAVEAWVREPEERARRAALQIAASGDTSVATTWLALAAGHSGGSIAPEDAPPVHASPDATAINLKAAVILAIVQHPMTEHSAWMRLASKPAYASPKAETPRCRRHRQPGSLTAAEPRRPERRA